MTLPFRHTIIHRCLVNILLDTVSMRIAKRQIILCIRVTQISSDFEIISSRCKVFRYLITLISRSSLSLFLAFSLPPIHDESTLRVHKWQAQVLIWRPSWTWQYPFEGHTPHILLLFVNVVLQSLDFSCIPFFSHKSIYNSIKRREGLIYVPSHDEVQCRKRTSPAVIRFRLTTANNKLPFQVHLFHDTACPSEDIRRNSRMILVVVKEVQTLATINGHLLLQLLLSAEIVWRVIWAIMKSVSSFCILKQRHYGLWRWIYGTWAWSSGEQKSETKE